MAKKKKLKKEVSDAVRDLTLIHYYDTFPPQKEKKGKKSKK